MRIAVTGTRGFPNVQGGIETHCERLYPLLVKLGCDVTVFTRKPYVEAGVTEFEGVKLVPLACPRRQSLEATIHTLKAVTAARRGGFDLIHIHAVGPSLMVPAARMLGMRVVMTHHGPDYDRQKWGVVAKAALRLGERLGCRWSDEVICVSKTICEIAGRLGSKRPRWIPNGVVVQEPAEGSDFLDQHGVEPGRYVLGVARFVEEKALHDLLEAFSRLETDHKLVIAGDADHESAYSRQLKDRARRTEGVVLTGFVKGEALRQLYTHASLFVLPSYHEGLPIALLEAMSYGLSVLVSDIAANKEVELEAGRYFQAANVEQLAGSLERLIKAGRLSKTDRRRQIESVRRRYDWEDIARQVLSVYEEICGN